MHAHTRACTCMLKDWHAPVTLIEMHAQCLAFWEARRAKFSEVTWSSQHWRASWHSCSVEDGDFSHTKLSPIRWMALEHLPRSSPVDLRIFAFNFWCLSEEREK